MSVEVFYKDDFIILYNADCLEILKDIPANTVDLLVTDPPYG